MRSWASSGAFRPSVDTGLEFICPSLLSRGDMPLKERDAIMGRFRREPRVQALALETCIRACAGMSLQLYYTAIPRGQVGQQ